MSAELHIASFKAALKGGKAIEAFKDLKKASSTKNKKPSISATKQENCNNNKDVSGENKPHTVKDPILEKFRGSLSGETSATKKESNLEKAIDQDATTHVFLRVSTEAKDPKPRYPNEASQKVELLKQMLETRKGMTTKRKDSKVLQREKEHIVKKRIHSDELDTLVGSDTELQRRRMHQERSRESLSKPRSSAATFTSNPQQKKRSSFESTSPFVGEIEINEDGDDSLITPPKKTKKSPDDRKPLDEITKEFDEVIKQKTPTSEMEEALRESRRLLRQRSAQLENSDLSHSEDLNTDALLNKMLQKSSDAATFVVLTPSPDLRASILMKRNISLVRTEDEQEVRGRRTHHQQKMPSLFTSSDGEVSTSSASNSMRRNRNDDLFEDRSLFAQNRFGGRRLSSDPNSSASLEFPTSSFASKNPIPGRKKPSAVDVYEFKASPRSFF